MSRRAGSPVVPNAVDAVFTPATVHKQAGSTCSPWPRSSRARTCGARSRLLARPLWSSASSVRGGGEGVDVEGWVGEVPRLGSSRSCTSGARCVLYPSLYEGFGLPVLEAMACGTAVVTSLGTAMEEVAGGAAILADATDVSSLAAAIGEAASPAGRTRR